MSGRCRQVFPRYIVQLPSATPITSIWFASALVAFMFVLVTSDFIMPAFLRAWNSSRLKATWGRLLPESMIAWRLRIALFFLFILMAIQQFFPVPPDIALLIENVSISVLSCGVDDISEVFDVGGDDEGRAVGDALVDDDFCIGDDDWLDAMYSSPPLTLKKGSTAYAAGSDSLDLALGQNNPDIDMASRD